MTDFGSFTDRAFLLPTDEFLVRDTVSGQGVNAPPGGMGGSDWTAGLAMRWAYHDSGHASSSHNGSAVGGHSAHLFRVDHVSTYIGLFNFAGTATVGSITTNGTSTSYNTSSDYRLKEDIRPVADPVAMLKKLKPINFRWKANGVRTDGFLAHEFGEVIRGACSGEKDAVGPKGEIIPQGIDQSKAIPLLVAALQAALARIEALERASAT